MGHPKVCGSFGEIIQVPDESMAGAEKGDHLFGVDHAYQVLFVVHDRKGTQVVLVE